MKENEYKCEICKNIYEKGVSDAEAEKELKENFDLPKEACGIVCDDCYNKHFKP